MANSIIKILSIIYVLSLISQGFGQCYPADIITSQKRTGVKVQGKTEWIVTITNKCSCPVKNLFLNCRKFQSIEPINPSILSIQSDLCLVNAGQPIYKDIIQFKYATDRIFLFYTKSFELFCS
ncbi:hypothetical protein VNO80_19946 [Phaseolus coccineus]|uniref:Uncharacterized protein n=1 Tax=Phaseolus coccineus TaxID=3886 RepID=A0AAN9R0B1_PHACN